MKKRILWLLLTICIFVSCKEENNIDARAEMRNFVISISKIAKQHRSSFIVIPQNGIELVTLNDQSNGPLATDYLTAIDGHGQEDLFYGYDTDDHATSKEDSDYLKSYLNRSKSAGNVILVTDYCSSQQHISTALTKNNAEGFVSFAAPERALNVIPPDIHNENKQDINHLGDAQNFLYLINPENFATKQNFIESVCATNYDVVIMDLFFHDGVAFTADEINTLQHKANGAKRLIIAYMSIGEAEDYRYYWQKS